ncbi:hypothetical protein PQE70_gp014 [Bacillus phage vB_BanS_Nate]|uniref:Uncharacterized protein n=1 Tax=Bacillus phage vB_BanS_Nate TaxID=2894788 RepID=A0AAE9CEE8_9CAUD|nr:hypothetical protein PQE70_gp014 [Bacillus phage vB_BanS_Nate]UGO50867.1 hypothetical protein NATE_14 [Bacillus phage vB_BanS_Nate]
MITYILNGVRESKCIICSNIETAVESIDGTATIVDIYINHIKGEMFNGY